MKKAIVLGLALILMLLFSVSCGVPQKDYDKVSSDLTTAQAEIQSLQGDLSAKESDLTAAQAEIQSLQGDLSAKEAGLSAKENELEATKGKLEQGKARIEILNAIFIPAMTGELEGMTDTESVAYFFEWRDKIMDIEDPELTAKFEALIETFSDEAFDEASSSFFTYLLESTADALE